MGDFFTQTRAQHFSPFYYAWNVFQFKLSENLILMHIITLVLLAAACLLIYLLIFQLTSKRKWAFFTALIFGLHPIQSVVVVNLSANFVFLFMIFSCISAILFLRWTSCRKWIFLIFSLIFHIVSLLIFEVGVVFPLYLFVFIYFFTQKKYRIVEAFRKVLPHLMVSIAYFMIWCLIAGGNAGLIEKLQMLSFNIVTYFSGLAFLIRWILLNLFYPHNIVHIFNCFPQEFSVFQKFYYIGTVTGFFIFLGVLCRRDRVLMGALLWFLIAFLLVFPASLVHAYMGMVIEPHWLIFSYIGFFLLVVAGWDQVTVKWPRKFKWIIGILFYMALYTANQPFLINALSEDSYCEYWREVSPRNIIPTLQLGTIYVARKEYDKAEGYFKSLTEMKNIWGLKEVYFNLATLSFNKGNLKKANEYLNKSLKIDPEYHFAYHLFATIEIKENGYTDLAESYFKRSLAGKDFQSVFILNLGDFYMLREKYQEAYDLFESNYGKFQK